MIEEEDDRVPAPGGLYGEPSQATARPGGPYMEPEQAAAARAQGVRRRGISGDTEEARMLDKEGLQARAERMEISFEQLQEPHILRDEPLVSLLHLLAGTDFYPACHLFC